MSKVTLTDLANLQNENTAVNAINANNALIEAAFDDALFRDGTSPNEMDASLDMNSNRILNLPAPITSDEPLRLQDLMDFQGGSLIIDPLPAGGTTGQFLTKASNTDYDFDWTDNPSGYYNVKDYGAVGDGVTNDFVAITAAITAATATDGNTLYFPFGDYVVNSTLVLDDTINLRIQGQAGTMTAGTIGSLIRSTAATCAISARNSTGIHFDRMVISSTRADRILDLRGDGGSTSSSKFTNGAFYHFNNVSPSTSRMCIDCDFNENVLIENCTFANQSCIGISGAADAAGYVINAHIKNCVFPTVLANTVHIKNPGNSWLIENCSFQMPTTFTCIAKGPAGRSSNVTLLSNWFGDALAFATAPLVTTNSTNFLSIGNTYASTIGGGGSSTCVQMDNSSGTLTSIGDWISADVGFAMGTGNTLSVINPKRDVTPTALFTGTIATTGLGTQLHGPVVIPGPAIIGGTTPAAGSFTSITGTSIAASSSIGLTNNQDASTSVSITNSDTGTNANNQVFYQANNGANTIRFGMRGQNQPAYGMLTSNTAFIYGATNLGIMSDGGIIKFAAGNNAQDAQIGSSGGLSVGTTTDSGAGTILANSSIKSQSSSAGVGYGTGAGGTVTQTTSRSTAVTINTVTGAITTDTTALAAGAFASFTVNNSSVAATDVIVLNTKSGTASQSTTCQIDAVSAGSFVITYRNQTGGNITAPIVFQYAVIKGVNS